MIHVRGLLVLSAVAIWTAACANSEVAAGPSTPLPAVTQRGRVATPSPSQTRPPARPSPSPSETRSASSPSPAPSAAQRAFVLAARGIGPYVIGTGMSTLKSRRLITNIVESLHCRDSYGAEATGRYARKLTFTFRGARLTSVHTDSTALVTPSGARVGMTLTTIQRLYGDRGRLITGVNGNKAFSVRVPGTALAVVFFLDAENKKVRSISAGEARPLEDAARAGEGC